MRRYGPTLRMLLRRFHRLTARLAPLAAAASAVLLIWHAAIDPSPSVTAAPAPLIYPGEHTPPQRPERTGPVGVQQAGFAPTIDVVIGRNEALDAIFRRLDLDKKADLAGIRDLPGIRQGLGLLKYPVWFGARKPQGAAAALAASFDPGSSASLPFAVANTQETRIRVASATIQHSLFGAARAAGIADRIALKLAHLFSWDIDFAEDVRPGDHFTVAYQQIYRHGHYLRDGRILAARFVNRGHAYEALRFTGPDGVAAYYTPNGQPMRKAFLRAPLDFTRVSSPFNLHRMNPVLHIIRPHLGTDFAAPMGTPVHAAGDGRVLFDGRENGYGNTVILAHKHGITTLYAHLSRFARKLRRGEPVREGQVIGYVGMSGLATGPHLHYEFRINGVHENPQTVRLPGAPPLRGLALADFRADAVRLVADLRASPTQRHAAPATAANLAPRSATPTALILPN